MSYFEYNDMFEEAQKTGKYHMFIFDIIGSKKYEEDLEYIYKTSKILFSTIYSKLEGKELTLGKKILHTIETNNPLDKEPFQFGDLFGFTVLRGSISEDEIYDIYGDEKYKLDIYWDFHVMNGYYETDDYALGSEKYFRGYCIQQLEELSKIEDKKRELNKKK